MTALRALVVDDQPEVRALIGLCLQHLGVQSVPAASSHEALDVLAHDSGFSVVFTDLDMPIMNGIELVDRIKCLYPGLPVVVMGAFHHDAQLKEARRRGAALSISKPFLRRDFDEVFKRLNLY